MPDEHDALEDERHPDRRDQGRETGRIAKGAVGDALERDVDAANDQHRDWEYQKQRDQVDRREVVLIEGEEAEDRCGYIGAQREHVAVGEVDQLDDAVDHRVAERYERVHRTVGEAEDRDLDEGRGMNDRLGGEEDDPGTADYVEAVVGEAHATKGERTKSRQS